MRLIPLAYRWIVWCSSLGASQHWSIPHYEIPLRFWERVGLPSRITVNRPILILTSRLEINSVRVSLGSVLFFSQSLTTFVYSPFQNSSSFPRTSLPVGGTAPARKASLSKTKRNFLLENRRMLWGLERGTWRYPVTSKWKGTHEVTAKLKWVDLQWDYIDLRKASFFLGNLLATSRSSTHPLIYPHCYLFPWCTLTSGG